MRKYWTGVSALSALLLVIFLLSLIPFRTLGTAKKPIRVVTSLNFYGEVAGEVAGKYGQVTSVINNASVDPHDYQPSTQQARAMGNANVVIQNGLGYDHWMTKLARSKGGQQVTMVDVARQVAGKKGGDNEHVWYQPATMGKLATTLADQYSQIDPSHADYYHRRARTYLKSLVPLNNEIARVKQGVKANQMVAVSEPVFDYALAHLGYRVMDPHFAKAIEDGNDPSPQDVADLQTAIKEHRIAFFVENSQSDDRVIDILVKLAHQHDVPVLKVTEAQPTGLNYRQWMMKQYQNLAKIQREEN